MPYAFVKIKKQGDMITGFFINTATGQPVPVNGTIIQSTDIALLAKGGFQVIIGKDAIPYVKQLTDKPLPSQKEIEGLHSLDLLKDPDYLARIDEYAIRIHYNNRPHFDFAVGNRADQYCIDFVIAGATKIMVESKKPYYPINRVVPIFFQPVHPIEFLIKNSGNIPIEAGPSKAGPWEVVQRGEAKFTIQDNNHLNLRLLNIGIKLTIIKGSQEQKNWLVRAETVSEKTTPMVTRKESAPEGQIEQKTIVQKVIPLESRWGGIKCKVWNKSARWAYYTNPFISNQIVAFLKWFGGTRIDTFLISEHEFDRNINKPKVTDGIIYAKKAIFRSIASVESILALEEPIAKLQEVNSGISDIMTRVPKSPKIMMLDIDVNVSKENAFFAVKSINSYMKYLGVNPWPVFSGKTGYHVFYQAVKSLDHAHQLVETMVETLNQQKWLRELMQFVAGVQHPGPGIVSIDWSQGSSPNKVVIVPFSLRWDSCFASVPVNFDKIPDFDPDIHANPDFVLANPKLFS